MNAKFDFLQLRGLVSTHYVREGASYKLVRDRSSQVAKELPLVGNGDFRSEECVELMKAADIVVTNPPFSLFREYVAQLMEHGKQFLIIGNINAVTYKETFPLIKANRIWLGVNGVKNFKLPDGSIQTFGNVGWFTNLPHPKRNKRLILCRKYHGNEGAYPTYDNYDAIEVARVVDIPDDYEGQMGVPISFLDKYNPEQFEILGTTESNAPNNAFRTRIYSSRECRDAYLARFGEPGVYDLNASGIVGGTKVFKRIIIKHRRSA